MKTMKLEKIEPEARDLWLQIKAGRKLAHIQVSKSALFQTCKIYSLKGIKILSDDPTMITFKF